MPEIENLTLQIIDFHEPKILGDHLFSVALTISGVTPVFGILLLATGLSAVANLIVSDFSGRRLPAPLLAAQEPRKAELRALSDRYPSLTWGIWFVMLSYFLSLAGLGAEISGARWAFLLSSVAWTAIGTWNAPNIQHRIAVPFYEIALLLNGSVLALVFFPSGNC